MMKNIKQIDWSMYILPAIASGIFLVVLALVILPTVSNFSALQSESEALGAQVLELSQKNQTIETLNSSELLAMRDKANVALPSEKSFPGLLSGLEALAKQSGSDLNSFEAAPRVISRSKVLKNATLDQVDLLISEQAKALSLNHLEANIGVKSDAASLIDLTSLLVKSSRLITLEEVSFSRPEAPGSGNSNVKIRLRVYFQPDEATVSGSTIVPISDAEKKLISQVETFNMFNLQLPDFLPSREDPFAKSLPLLPTPQASSSPVVQP